MKENIIGVLSGILLVLVMIGNTVFTAITEQAASETATAVQEQVQLPVLMYHQILKDPARQGAYVTSPQQFEKDLQYIQKEGYQTVTLAQIENYVTMGEPLPEKPILITFDDGYESAYGYIYPLLKEYKMHAVISIVGKYTDLYSGNITKSMSYAHASWDELREMQRSGTFEVQNHTYDLHKTSPRKGVRKLDSESESQYRELLLSDLGSLNDEIEEELSVRPIAFAYPFGAFSKSTDPLLREMGFRIVMTSEEKVNYLSPGMYPNGELIRLKRFNRANGLSSEAFFAKWEKN